MDRITVENDIQPVAIAIAVKGKDLVLDPSMYTVEFELKVKEALKEETKLMEAGDEVKAIRLMTDLFAELVLPANPDWTKDEIYQKCSRQHIGWAYGFFAVMAPSAGQIKKETAERIAGIITGKLTASEEDSTGTPKTPDDQTSPPPESKSESSASTGQS